MADYDKLHIANLDWYGKTCDSFYHEIEKDGVRLKLYYEAFKAEIQRKVSNRIYKLLRKQMLLESVSLMWIEEKKSLMIYLILQEDDSFENIANELNGDKEMEEHAAIALKKIYRFSGSFYFESDIPF